MALSAAVSYDQPAVSHCRTDAWVLDSGATAHMTGDLRLLSDFIESTHSNTVTYGNGHIAAVAGIGNAIVYTAEEPKGIKLRNVLYVPEASYNLLSLPKAVNSGAEVVLSSDGCTITVDGRKIASAKHSADGLFYLGGSKGGEAALLSKPVETAALWHRRYGHLGFDNLAKLVAGSMVTGVNVSAGAFSAASKAACEPCILAKHHRDPFPQSGSKSEQPLQLVHMDICGPLQVPSLGHAHYFATYLDDYSKLSIIQPMLRKSDVAGHTRDVLKYLETQSGYTVRAVRSDNGGEYVSKEMEGYFADKGIEHQRTVSYTPQQNGKAERLNRTLMERVRAMLEDSLLPEELWAEAVATASYIRNRSPVHGESKTPWELFHGTKPDVTMMRTFGAVAYAHVPAQRRRKLDSKSERGRMVGYAASTKGYRIMLEDSTIIISRDVVFDEGSSPLVAASSPLVAASSPLVAIDPPAAAAGGGEQATAGAGGRAAAGQAEPTTEAAAEVTAGATAEATAEATASEYGTAQESVGDDTTDDKAETSHGPQRLRYPVRARRPPTEWSWKAKAALAATATYKVPATLAEALASEHAVLWQAAVDKEIASLLANGTWEEGDLPNGKHAIDTKWVFKYKFDTDGNLERCKARLVVKGFKQREGVDYDETYAPVSKHASLRATLSLTAARNYELHAMDITTAFLNGVLEEVDEVYINLPAGYQAAPGKVGRLRRALYGLKQAPRVWHKRLKEVLESIGFAPADADASLFSYNHKSGQIFLLVYVDDLLIAAPSLDGVNYTKEKVMAAFAARDLGEATAYLGMSITRNRAAGTLKLSQSNMVVELVDSYGLSKAAPKRVPLSPSVQLSSSIGKPLDTTKYPYSALIGSLQYLASCTRPDISFTVGALGKYSSKPTTAHWTAALNVVRYLKGTAELGICYGGSSCSSSDNSTKVLGYSDADFAGDVDTRRSTTGYVFILNGGAISWSSRHQKTVATSTMEAEYMAQAAAAKEGLWVRKLQRNLGIKDCTIKIFADNQAAIKLANNPTSSARSKHIDVMHHFVRERVASGEIEFEYVATASQVADALTKAVPENQFLFCRDGMGVC